MKKFFGFIFVIAIIGGVAFFFVKNKNGKSENVSQPVVSETTEQNTWDTVSNEISNGIEAVGKGIKSGISKVKGDSKSESVDEKGLFDKLGDKVKVKVISANKMLRRIDFEMV